MYSWPKIWSFFIVWKLVLRVKKRQQQFYWYRRNVQSLERKLRPFARIFLNAQTLNIAVLFHFTIYLYQELCMLAKMTDHSAFVFCLFIFCFDRFISLYISELIRIKKRFALIDRAIHNSQFTSIKCVTLSRSLILLWLCIQEKNLLFANDCFSSSK